MHVFKVHFGDVSLHADVFAQGVENRQANFAFLLFKQFFADAHIPEQVILVKTLRQTAVHLVAEFGLVDKSLQENPVETQARILAEIFAVQVFAQAVAHDVVAGIGGYGKI